ncbi:MAG: hypothetical protein ACREQB_05725 [Candidatus Binataceae bacterium]
MRRTVIAMMLLAISAAAAGCAAPPAKVVVATAPMAAVSAPIGRQGHDDWNIFPDPTTGRVEIYKNGEYVGSVTGEEIEDPPLPRKRD